MNGNEVALRAQTATALLSAFESQAYVLFYCMGWGRMGILGALMKDTTRHDRPTHAYSICKIASMSKASDSM